MTGMDILEFRDINQPPPVGKIIGDEENAPGGEDSSPPGPNRVNFSIFLVISDEHSLWVH